MEIRKKALFAAVAVCILAGAVQVSAVNLIWPKDGSFVETTIPRLHWFKGEFKLFEVIVWAEDGKNIVFHAFPTDDSIAVSEEKLEMGKTYIWSVRERESLEKVPEGDFGARYKFTIGEGTGKDAEKFVKTGATLVVPVEFSDYTYASKGSPDYRAEISRKMDGLREYFRILSRSSSQVDEQTSYDIAPLVSIDKPLKHYGRDRKIFGKSFTDSGDFFPGHMGAIMMKRVAVKETFRKGVPVNKYDHVIYLTPGDAGYTDDDRFWPHSVAGSPRNMFYIPRVHLVVGLFFTGIVQGIKVSTGTFCHEFGHQFGLPDLYPYKPLIKTKWFSIGGSPKRDLGLFGMMASGNHYGETGIGMCSLSKKRSYSGAAKKKNWIKDQVQYVTESGKYTLSSRDSHLGTTGLVVDIPGTSKTSDCYMVELFDRKRIDKDMVAYGRIEGRFSRLNAGVFIYRANSDNVDRISTLRVEPFFEDKGENEQVYEGERYFLAGGSFPSGGVPNLGTVIKVESLQDMGDHWEAVIDISLLK